MVMFALVEKKVRVRHVSMSKKGDISSQISFFEGST